MEIPSKYNAKEVEDRIYKEWVDKGYFHAKPSLTKKPFCIVIPPPNVTGILHMGHALNNTIQDVLIRFKRMQGYESLWMPGTDHAGIATQNVVEKDLAKKGLKKEDIGREEFMKELWKWTDKHGSTIIEQLKKLGASCDWERTRFTMDDEYSQAVKEVFVRLYEKGLIYRGNYIINWCPRCKTALSDEEAVHHEIEGWLYYIKYPVYVKKSGSVSDSPSYLIVATTRPETMLGDTAVAVNPNDERYAYLKGAKVILPIVERELKVIKDEAVDPKFGTGVVKVTPAHDPVDFIIGKKHNLEFINIMNEDATLNEHVPEDFIGMDRFEARQAVLELLEEKKLIEKKEPYKVSAGHCYRCHTIIEPYVSDQWFVKMKPLAKEAIKVVEKNKIEFHPSRWKKVYLNWMNNIQDWCISRQIWWGHRLPVYYCTKCQKVEGDKPKGTGEVKRGIVVSKVKPTRCPDCGSLELVQDRDVLDTWFSSWLWPFATFYWPFETTRDEGRGTRDEGRVTLREYSGQAQDEGRRIKDKEDLKYFYPTDVLVTASEILFFWVARMIMAGLEFMKEIPFRHVFIHGTVRDARGIKMSKSLGNIIDPLEIIDKFGADALRFSLMLLSASGSDVYLSDEKFLVGRNFCNKVWNAARFGLFKIKENNINIDSLEFKQLDGVDKWVLKELDSVIEEVTLQLDNFRINESTKKIYDFFWHTFCDWYLEIVKDNFSLDRAKVFVSVMVNSMKLLHPVMPYISEEVFKLIKSCTSLSMEDSIVVSSWPVLRGVSADEEVKKIEAIISTVREMRTIKTDLGLGTRKVKLEVAVFGREQGLWQVNQQWIKRLGILEEIVFKDSLNRVLYKNDLWGFNFDVEEIDKNNFITSLEKKINELSRVCEKASNRLRNEKFLNSASPETVEEEKNKFNEITIQLNRLEELRRAFCG